MRAEVVDDLEDDDDHLIVSHNRRDPEVFDVFRINVRTGEEQLIAQNPGNIVSWGTDHDGKLRVAGTADGVTTTLLYRATEQDEFRPLLTTDFKETVSPLFFTFDNQRLYVASNRGRDKAAIFEFDPATAQEGRLLVEHPEVDVEGLNYLAQAQGPDDGALGHRENRTPVLRRGDRGDVSRPRGEAARL